MDTTTEFELKFCIPPERLVGVRAALIAAAAATATAPQRTRLQAHYVDTPDAALARARIALRLRKEGRRWVQTLKAAGASRVHRLEHEVALAPAAARGGGLPALDLGRHRGSDAGDALARALAQANAEPSALAVRYRTDVRRRQVTVDTGRAQVEVALDEGHIAAVAQSVPVCELELELKSGDAAGLFELAERWRAEHGLWLSTVSKAERGERLAAGLTDVPPVKAGTPRIDAGMHGGALLRAVVASCLEQIVGNASEVASGRYGAEHVHQLRVGIRRLRSVLRELHGLAPQAVDAGWEPPLVDAFRALGDYRDRDVAIAAVQPRLLAAGAPPVEWQAAQPHDAAAAPSPEEAVRADAFQALLLRLLAHVTAPAADPASTLDAHAAHALLRQRLRKLHRQVAADGRRFEQLAEAAQHRVRKRLKRLRYLAEAVAPLFRRRAVERYLRHLRPAQDALGAHNDAHVALGLYRQAAEHEPRAWFAVGWLQAEQAASAAVCRRALKPVARAKRFWTKKG